MELFIYILLTSIMAISDVKMHKQYITPYTTFSLTYLVLLIFHGVISVQYGFLEISGYTTLVLLLFNLIVFSISIYSSFIHNFIYKVMDDKKKIIEAYLHNTVVVNKKLIVTLFIIGLVSKYISLIQSIRIFGIDNIKGNSFGIFAHIGSLGLVLSPYILFFIIVYKERKYILLWLLLLANLVIFGGKYGIIFFALHNILFLSLVMRDSFLKLLRKVFLIIFFSLLTFILIYGVVPLLLSNILTLENLLDRMSFILKHFSYYLTSPLVAMDQFLISPGPIRESLQIIFTVPINIWNAIIGSGNYVVPVLDIRVPVSFEYTTNVAGIIGELVNIGGWAIAILLIATIYFFINIQFMQSTNRGRNLSLSSFMLSISTMSFFSNFYTVSGIVLQIIFLYILEIILRNRGKRNTIEEVSDNTFKLER